MQEISAQSLESRRTLAFSTLFMTQMWECFSGFGLRALMVLYFIQEWHWSDPHAYAVFGTYVTLMCVMPVIGGVLCDQLWGHRITTIVGGCFIATGHLCLTFLPSQHFLMGLAFVVVGSGLIVPSLCSLVGLLYPNDKPRHDRAYNLYYMSVNIGGIFAGLVVGLVAHRYGWHAGFGLAAIGMITALCIFCFGWRTIAPFIPNSTLKIRPTHFNNILIFTGLIACVGAITFVLHHTSLTAWLVVAMVVLTAMIFARLLRSSDSRIRLNMWLLILLNILSVCFFIMYEQSGTSINLFSERVIDRHFFSFLVPTPVLFSINPIFIIVLAPLLGLFWKYLATHRTAPKVTTQVAFGLILSATGFLTLALAAQYSHPPLIWLIASVFQTTLGELCVGPVLLAAISEYAPAHVKSTLMGVWYMMGAIASYLAAFVAKFTSVAPATPDVHSSYAQVFTIVGYDGLLIGVATLLAVMIYNNYNKRSAQ